MRLYHFTAPAARSHLGSILREGWIRTTESNVSLEREHAGPDVVWLTTDGAPEAHAGWAVGLPGPIDGAKTWARLTVDVNDAVPWKDFATQHAMKRRDREALTAFGDGDSWWVALRPIPRKEWAELQIALPDHYPLIFKGNRLRALTMPPSAYSF